MAKVTKKSSKIWGFNLFFTIFLVPIPLVLESLLAYYRFGEVQLFNLVILCSEMLFFYFGLLFMMVAALKASRGNYISFENSIYASIGFIIAGIVLRVLRDYRMIYLFVPVQLILLLGFPFIALTYGYKRRNENDWKGPGYWMVALGIAALVFWFWMVSKTGWTAVVEMGNLQYVDNGTLFLYVLNYLVLASCVFFRKRFIANKLSNTILISSLTTSLLALFYGVGFLYFQNGVTGIYLFFCSYLPFYSLGTIMMLLSVAVHYQHTTYFSDNDYI